MVMAKAYGVGHSDLAKAQRWGATPIDIKPRGHIYLTKT